MAEDEARQETGGWRWPLGPIRILIIATAVLSVVFLLIPSLDLWFSRQFYDADIGFPAVRIPALQWLRDVAGLLLWAAGAVVVISLLAKILLFPRRRSLVPGRAMLFLSATLALSAGLLVNGILKSLWGRPRPTQVLDFGGDAPFVTAWHISDYCARNCSFVSGEASSAIWLVAIALVVPTRFRRAALAAAIALAFAFSLNRIAFGGHFLSDVLIAWTLTLLIIAVAWHFLYVRPPRFFEESAIDSALTRAGLWLRGLFSRRQREPAPLHPEAAAVLSVGVAGLAAEPSRPPRGFRSAGHGFAGSAAQDAEDHGGESMDDQPEGDPTWAEDIHRDHEPAVDEDIAADRTVDAASLHQDEPDHDVPGHAPIVAAPFHEEHARAVEAVVRDAVESRLDLTEDVTLAEPNESRTFDTAPEGVETTADDSLETIDPEPDDAPARASADLMDRVITPSTAPDDALPRPVSDNASPTATDRADPGAAKELPVRVVFPGIVIAREETSNAEAAEAESVEPENNAATMQAEPVEDDTEVTNTEMEKGDSAGIEGSIHPAFEAEEAEPLGAAAESSEPEPRSIEETTEPSEPESTSADTEDAGTAAESEPPTPLLELPPPNRT